MISIKAWQICFSRPFCSGLLHILNRRERYPAVAEGSAQSLLLQVCTPGTPQHLLGLISLCKGRSRASTSSQIPGWEWAGLSGFDWLQPAALWGVLGLNAGTSSCAHWSWGPPPPWGNHWALHINPDLVIPTWVQWVTSSFWKGTVMWTPKPQEQESHHQSCRKAVQTPAYLTAKIIHTLTGPPIYVSSRVCLNFKQWAELITESNCRTFNAG